MKILRWILAAPAGIAAWYGTLFVGVFAYERIETLLCPIGQMYSGTCTNPSVRHVLDGVVGFFVAISAIAVVGATAAVAPSHRGPVAWIAFGVGAIFAVYFMIGTTMYISGPAAIAAGALTAMTISRSVCRPPNQKNLEVTTPAP